MSIGPPMVERACAMTGFAKRLPDELIETAIAWHYRLQAAPDDDAQRKALAAWLAEDPRHADAWELAGNAWRLTGETQPATRMGMPGRLRDGQATLRRSRPWLTAALSRRAGVGLALAACLALLAVLSLLRMETDADYAAGTAETRQVMLDDGSVVHLNAGGAVSVDFDPGERAITLLRGEAFFEVARDRTRSFVVRADDLVVTVTGTAFDIDASERTFSIAVAHGSVRVDSHAKTVDLAPGQSLVIDRRTGHVKLGAVHVPDVASWRAGRLIVEDAVLADVVDAIARYHRGVIVTIGGSGQERRVTGAYDLNDPARALRALVGAYGGTVHQMTPYLLVLSGL